MSVPAIRQTRSTRSRPRRSSGSTPDDAELLIDCEEDRTLRAVLVGMLREADQGRGRRTRSRGAAK